MSDRNENKCAEENDDDDSWQFCKFCKIPFKSEAAFHMHLRGIVHINNEAKWEEVNTKAEGNRKESSEDDKSFHNAESKNENVESFHDTKNDDKRYHTNFKNEDNFTLKDLKDLEDQQYKEEQEENRLYCTVCDIKFDKEQQFWLHSRGLAHYSKVEEAERKRNPQPEPEVEEKDPEYPPWSYCEACDVEFNSEGEYKIHVKTEDHIKYQEEYDAEMAESDKPQAIKNKGWEAAHERDLTPFDVGKGGSVTYYCEVCEVSTTGAKCFQAHLAGKSHLKKLKRKEEVENPDSLKGPGKSIPKPKSNRSIIANELERCSLPLVGIDYMTEYRPSDSSVEPKFSCDLCQTKMDPRQVIAHLTGEKHREKYFKFHAPRFKDRLWGKKKSEKVVLAEKFALEIEKREGRHSIRVRVQVNPFENDEKGDWKDVTENGARPVTELPGIASLDSLAKYKDYSEIDDDLEEEQDMRSNRGSINYGTNRDVLPRDPNNPYEYRERLSRPWNDPYYYSEAYYNSSEYIRDYYYKYGTYPPKMGNALERENYALSRYGRLNERDAMLRMDNILPVGRLDVRDHVNRPYAPTSNIATNVYQQPPIVNNINAAQARSSTVRNEVRSQTTSNSGIGGAQTTSNSGIGSAQTTSNSVIGSAQTTSNSGIGSAKTTSNSGIGSAQTLVKEILQQYSAIKNSYEKAQRQNSIHNTPETQRTLQLVRENLSQASKQAKDLLACLGHCVVETEEDAEMAIEITKSLTQALVGYRIHNLPKETVPLDIQKKLSGSVPEKTVSSPAQPIVPPITSQNQSFQNEMSSGSDFLNEFDSGDATKIPGLTKHKEKASREQVDLESFLYKEKNSLSGQSAGFERAKIRKLQQKSLEEENILKRRKQADDMYEELMNKRSKRQQEKKSIENENKISNALQSAQATILKANKLMGIVPEETQQSYNPYPESLNDSIPQSPQVTDVEMRSQNVWMQPEPSLPTSPPPNINTGNFATTESMSIHQPYENNLNHGHSDFYESNFQNIPSNNTPFTAPEHTIQQPFEYQNMQEYSNSSLTTNFDGNNQPVSMDNNLPISTSSFDTSNIALSAPPNQLFQSAPNLGNAALNFDFNKSIEELSSKIDVKLIQSILDSAKPQLPSTETSTSTGANFDVNELDALFSTKKQSPEKMQTESNVQDFKKLPPTKINRSDDWQKNIAASTSNQKESKKTICTHFLAGKCRRNEANCRFSHDIKEMTSKSLEPNQKSTLCALCWDQVTTLDEHLQHRHKFVVPYVCGVCDIAFPNYSVSNTHLISHIHAKDVTLEELQIKHTESIRYMKKMKENGAIVHDFEHDVTEKFIRYEFNKYKTDRAFRCPYCSLMFGSYAWILGHVREHTQFGPFWCGFCKRRFVESGKLHNHITDEHATSEPYYCWCGLMCKKAAKINQHQIEDHVDKEERKKMDSMSCKKPIVLVTYCSFCNQKFPKETSFKEHLRQCYKNSRI